MQLRLFTKALLLCCLLFATASLAQQAIPSNDGWVTDGAGFLTVQQE